jgi:hypothetical protein
MLLIERYHSILLLTLKLADAAGVVKLCWVHQIIKFRNTQVMFGTEPTKVLSPFESDTTLLNFSRGLSSYMLKVLDPLMARIDKLKIDKSKIAATLERMISESIFWTLGTISPLSEDGIHVSFMKPISRCTQQCLLLLISSFSRFILNSEIKTQSITNFIPSVLQCSLMKYMTMCKSEPTCTSACDMNMETNKTIRHIIDMSVHICLCEIWENTVVGAGGENGAESFVNDHEYDYDGGNIANDECIHDHRGETGGGYQEFQGEKGVECGGVSALLCVWVSNICAIDL